MNAKTEFKDLDNNQLALTVFDRLTERHGRQSNLAYNTLRDLFDEIRPRGSIRLEGGSSNPSPWLD